MADARLDSPSSFPIHSSCLESKMARIIPENHGPKTFTNGKGGLIHGDFNVEALLEELTIEEKVSLLAGKLNDVATRLQTKITYSDIRKGLLAHNARTQTEDSLHQNFRRTQWSAWHTLLRQHAFSLLTLRYCDRSNIQPRTCPAHWQSSRRRGKSKGRPRDSRSHDQHPAWPIGWPWI